jgi:hypothetical protein
VVIYFGFSWSLLFMVSLKCEKVCMKNVTVKVCRKRMLLLVELSVMRCENIGAVFAKC